MTCETTDLLTIYLLNYLFYNFVLLFIYLQMALLKSIYDGYRDLMDNHADPRTTNWPLMSSPFPTMAISLCYAYFAKVRLLNGP